MSAAGNALADRVAQQHGGAAVPRAPLGQRPQPRHGNSHPHQLLDELRCDIGLHPPRSQKAPPHRSGHRHKRQAGGQNQQRGLGADIVQQIPCTRPGPVLSLQITSVDTMYNRDVGAYHYNFETGKELSNIEMLEYLGYTDNDLTLKALQRAVAQR